MCLYQLETRQLHFAHVSESQFPFDQTQKTKQAKMGGSRESFVEQVDVIYMLVSGLREVKRLHYSFSGTSHHYHRLARFERLTTISLFPMSFKYFISLMSPDNSCLSRRLIVRLKLLETPGNQTHALSSAYQYRNFDGSPGS